MQHHLFKVNYTYAKAYILKDEKLVNGYFLKHFSTKFNWYNPFAKKHEQFFELMQLTITICCDLVKVWAFIDKWKTCNIFSPNFPRSNCVLHFAWNLQLCLIHIYISTYTIFVCNWNFICANCWAHCTNCKCMGSNMNEK